MSGSPDMLLDAAPRTEPVSGGEPAERVRRAARLECPFALGELARDPDLIVRATVALNSRCDRNVDAILASDSDERIRALLGGRVARLLSNMDADEQTEAAEHVQETLQALAADQAVRVRAAVADELASAQAAPRELVLKLAQDVASEVSDRVIRLSPLLSDADLLAIMTSPRSANAAASIAGRRKLSAVVADAIVQHADAQTIQALLNNDSARIREGTLDVLVGRAPSHVDWHAPLVRRPGLSAHAIRTLSEFITVDLLNVLASRTNLDGTKLAIVRQRLAAQEAGSGEAAMQQARELQAAGGLHEAALLEATRLGDTRLLLAELAVSSGTGLETVERVLELRSAKGLVSLVWRSGYSMSLAVAMQNLLSQFGPDTAILPNSSGGFPLTEQEMMWQIELMIGVDTKTDEI